LVIGDSCIDRFIYGTCDRLSPEAPVPVLKHIETKEMPGMAGNVVENIKAFSSNVTLLTQDHEITKVRYVDSKSNQHIMRFDTEPPLNGQHGIFSADDNLALSAVSGDYDAVILSDYNKGFLTEKQITRLTDRMKQCIYVDSKKKDISCFKNSIIKLNNNEYKASGYTVDISSSIIKTLGSRGASYNGCIYPVQFTEVFDVSGAGDTFLAAFTIYHAVTNDIINAIKFANKCASIVVQKSGTYALKVFDIKNQENK
tara:strand:- start:422 stop:1189 length:768 start_codon:yes stop_codon:yes gene_type:complete